VFESRAMQPQVTEPSKACRIERFGDRFSSLPISLVSVPLQMCFQSHHGLTHRPTAKILQSRPFSADALPWGQNGDCAMRKVVGWATAIDLISGVATDDGEDR
jgi:hypothetical protein